MCATKSGGGRRVHADLYLRALAVRDGGPGDAGGGAVAADGPRPAGRQERRALASDEH